MISFEEALDIIISSAPPPAGEEVDLQDASGRVLACDIHSDICMPPFNKSAMDGFACRREDLAGEMKVTETIKAGDMPQKKIGRGECARIMTGAMVPVGADCVIMVEHTSEVSPDRIVFTGSKTADNIALRGEDIKEGDVVMRKGVIIKPQHIAVMASVGCVNPNVYKRPRVAVLNTGDEIVEPSVRPEGTCIRNSNGPQLVAQISNTGALPDYMGIVADTPGATDRAVKNALERNDIVLITGGVSAGDFDYVPGILKDNGIEPEFETVAVKPGRPTVFARRGNTFVFGLPGNPVSSYIIFELMVKPFIYQWMGHRYSPPPIRMPLATDYKRKKSDRIAWVPVFFNERGEAMPVDYHGSAHIHALCHADGIMPVHKGVNVIKKGELADVRQI